MHNLFLVSTSKKKVPAVLKKSHRASTRYAAYRITPEQTTHEQLDAKGRHRSGAQEPKRHREPMSSLVRRDTQGRGSTAATGADRTVAQGQSTAHAKQRCLHGPQARLDYVGASACNRLRRRISKTALETPLPSREQDQGHRGRELHHRLDRRQLLELFHQLGQGQASDTRRALEVRTQTGPRHLRPLRHRCRTPRGRGVCSFARLPRRFASVTVSAGEDAKRVRRKGRVRSVHHKSQS